MLWLRATSDRTARLLAAEADVTRLRLMIDARRGFTAGAGTLTPTIEAGIRHDGGDAEEGVGFEVSGGIAYQGASVTIEGNVRTLVAHDDSAYREWRASAAIRIDPGGDGRGMSLSITPTWGSAASEAEQLWSTRTAEELVSDAEFEANHRLDAEVGYGRTERSARIRHHHAVHGTLSDRRRQAHAEGRDTVEGLRERNGGP